MAKPELNPSTGSTLQTRDPLRQHTYLPIEHFQPLKDPKIDPIIKAGLIAEITGEGVFDRLCDVGLMRPVSKFANDVGFHGANTRELDPFLESLRKKKITIIELVSEVKTGDNKGQIQRYYGLIACDFDEAEKTWKEDPDLKRFENYKVIQIAGLTQKTPPSTWDINQRRGVVPIRDVLADLGIRTRTKTTEILGDPEECPVAVWQYQKSFSIYDSDRKAFEKFLRRRLRRLNIVPTQRKIEGLPRKRVIFTAPKKNPPA